MTKEHEQAIKNLESFIDHFHTNIKKAEKANDCAFDFTQAEYDIMTFGIAIQAIKDLDKMNGIALDLASENDDLIEKLDSIRAEIEQITDTMGVSYNQYVSKIDVLQIIDKYRKGGEI